LERQSALPSQPQLERRSAQLWVPQLRRSRYMPR